jgi:hypothetical protein
MRGNRGGVLKVVLIVVGAIALVVVCAGIYVSLNWKGWAANAAYTASQAVVQESGLPDDQKSEILSEVHQLGEDFKTGKITTQQMALIVRTIGDSPLVPLAGVQAARKKYIEPADMKPEEKADAILNLQRFARGVHEKKIPKEEVNEVVKPVSDLKPNGRWTLKENPTRLELDQFIANVKARADKADIPNEPFDLNIAEELKKAIHSVS